MLPVEWTHEEVKEVRHMWPVWFELSLHDTTNVGIQTLTSQVKGEFMSKYKHLEDLKQNGREAFQFEVETVRNVLKTTVMFYSREV